MIDMMLYRYTTAINSVVPDLKKLFSPHLNKVRSALDPGLAEINWTSHEWKAFTETCLGDIESFKDLVDRANDIYENRVEKLLESMTSVELYELPTAEPWTLDKFLDKVKGKCKSGSKELQKRSTMVEDAIEDLIALALEFKNGGEIGDCESASSIKAMEEEEEDERREMR